MHNTILNTNPTLYATPTLTPPLTLTLTLTLFDWT